jgi:hypothetical protein
MYKFVKILFLAAITAVAITGTSPFAKGKDVHNKAPGIEQVAKAITAYQVDVVAQFEVADIIPAPAIGLELQYGDYVPTIYTEEAKSITFKRPDLVRRRYVLSDYDYRRTMIKWKDFHRKLCSV